MPIFYRGAGVGTYWHQHDARLTGFMPKTPMIVPSVDRVMQHVARGTISSPYISLTRSYGVAWSYAVGFGRAQLTPSRPAYVYEIELENPLPQGLQLIDPVKEIILAVASPLAAITYQHDGLPNFLLGVIDPDNMRKFLDEQSPQPPPASGTPRRPNLTIELETIVRSLRDAEILAIGNIPAALIRQRIEVLL
jgi:hypothetical protein